jgi:hypothetical protein
MAELIWESQYDADGRKTAPLRVVILFQTARAADCRLVIAYVIKVRR